MKSKILISRSKISTSVAVSIWLTLLSLPLFISYYSLIAFADFSLNNEINDLKPKINLEVQKFKEDVMPRIFIENLLDQFNKKSGFINYSNKEVPIGKFENLNAKQLLKSIEKFTRIKVACLFYYGPDTKAISFAKGSILGNCKLRKPPNLLLERFFGLLNDQYKIASLKYKTPGERLARYLRQIKKEKAKADSDFFLRTIFGNIDEIKIKDKAATNCISSKICEIGNTIFYFSKATCSIKGHKANLGGYLVVFRLRDIPPNLLAKQACRKTFYKKLHRKVVFSKVSLTCPDNLKPLGIYKIIEDDKKVYLDSMLPQSLLVFLVQRGTLVPKGLTDIRNKLPLLRVFVNKSDLRPGFYKYLKIIKFFMLIIFLIGTIFIVRLNLFGFNFSMSIKGKILLGISFSLILPVALFLFSGNLYNNFSNSIEKSVLKRTMENKLLEIKKTFSNFLRKKEIQNLEMAKSIEKVVNQNNKLLEPYLAKWLKNTGAETINLLRNNAEPITFQKKGIVAKSDSINNSSIFFGTFLLSMLNNAELRLPSIKIILSEKGDEGLASQRDALNHLGEMIRLEKVSPSSKFACIILYDKQGKPSGYLQIEYSMQKLATDFFSQSNVQKEMSEYFSGYDIDFSYSIKNTKSGRYDINSRKLTSLENKQLALSLKLKTPIQWESGDTLKYIEPVSDLNYVGIVTAKPHGKLSNEYFKSIIKTITILVFIFIFVLLLAQLFYVRPVKAISNQLHQIANNNLDYRCRLNTGDEFEMLANSFNEMAKDIAQKEQLEKFVSKDVLDDMHKMGTEDLKPGGDLIEASVLFCEIDNFEDYSKGHEADEIIELLNNFVAIVSKVCRANYGVIDKTIEGTLMVSFKKGEHAYNACKTALGISLALNKLTSNKFSCHSGISTGKLISGKIGSKSGKLDFTVIGDTVNMAARLKSIHSLGRLTKILVSKATKEAIRKYANCHKLGNIKIKGKQEEQPVYEIIEIA